MGVTENTVRASWNVEVSRKKAIFTVGRSAIFRNLEKHVEHVYGSTNKQASTRRVEDWKRMQINITGVYTVTVTHRAFVSECMKVTSS